VLENLGTDATSKGEKRGHVHVLLVEEEVVEGGEGKTGGKEKAIVRGGGSLWCTGSRKDRRFGNAFVFTSHRGQGHVGFEENQQGKNQGERSRSPGCPRIEKKRPYDLDKKGKDHVC